MGELHVGETPPSLFHTQPLLRVSRIWAAPHGADHVGSHQPAKPWSRTSVSPKCTEPMEHPHASLGSTSFLSPLKMSLSHCRSKMWRNPHPKGRTPNPGGEHLHDTWLGAQAVGLVVVGHKVTGQLPLDVGETAGGWWVRANCEGKDSCEQLQVTGEQGQGAGTGVPMGLGGCGGGIQKARSFSFFLKFFLIWVHPELLLTPHTCCALRFACPRLNSTHGAPAKRRSDMRRDPGWKGWQKGPCPHLERFIESRLTWCSRGLVAEGGDENSQGNHRDLHVNAEVVAGAEAGK